MQQPGQASHQDAACAQSRGITILAHPVVLCLILPQLGCVGVERAGVVGLTQQALHVKHCALTQVQRRSLQASPFSILVCPRLGAWSTIKRGEALRCMMPGGFQAPQTHGRYPTWMEMRMVRTL